MVLKLVVSIRIHDSELQQEIFNILGLSKEEQNEKFGFFLRTLQSGCPPHGGIAFGLIASNAYGRRRVN